MKKTIYLRGWPIRPVINVTSRKDDGDKKLRPKLVVRFLKTINNQFKMDHQIKHMPKHGPVHH